MERVTARARERARARESIQNTWDDIPRLKKGWAEKKDRKKKKLMQNFIGK